MKVCAVTIILCLAEATCALLGNMYMDQVRKPPLVIYFAGIRYCIRYHGLFCLHFVPRMRLYTDEDKIEHEILDF